jgi:hypothetical protein
MTAFVEFIQATFRAGVAEAKRPHRGYDRRANRAGKPIELWEDCHEEA